MASSNEAQRAKAAVTVLVADDRGEFRSMVGRILSDCSDAPYIVLEAASGEEALRLARTHRPDVVLCDLHMPGLGGDEVLRQLRADPELGGTRVVMMTADVRAGCAAVLAGADALLPKPFLMTDLLRTMAS